MATLSVARITFDDREQLLAKTFGEAVATNGKENEFATEITRLVLLRNLSLFLIRDRGRVKERFLLWRRHGRS